MDPYFNKSQTNYDQRPENNRFKTKLQTVNDQREELRKLTVNDCKTVAETASDPIGRDNDEEEAAIETLAERESGVRGEEQRHQSNACLSQ